MSVTTPGLPAGVRRVRERPRAGALPLYELGEWSDAFPWLVHGTTGHGGDRREEPFDLGLFGDGPVGPVMARWRTLREATGLPRAVHSLQVHGREIAEHQDDGPGLLVLEGLDGHATGRPGVLLAVAVADCVPISIVDARRRRVAVLHGGWRGTAAGVIAAGLARLGGDPVDLHAHLGPAICGECYEVGPEVHEGLGLAVPESNTPVDLRAVQARQLLEAGLAAERVTVSEHCTLCGTGFFSHRGGAGGRQMGFIGIR